MVMAIYVFAGTMIGTPSPSGHELDALVFLPLQISLLFDLIVFKLEAPASSLESAVVYSWPAHTACAHDRPSVMKVHGWTACRAASVMAQASAPGMSSTRSGGVP